MIKIKRQKINWIIEKNRIVAYDKMQATSYNLLGDNLKRNLIAMKKELQNNEVGNNWVEVIELASKHHLRGVAIMDFKRDD